MPITPKHNSTFSGENAEMMEEFAKELEAALARSDKIEAVVERAYSDIVYVAVVDRHVITPNMIAEHADISMKERAEQVLHGIEIAMRAPK